MARSMSQPNLKPALYHLISRFVAGEWFIKSDLEREVYLRLLADALKTSDWKCLAYGVMSNHVHLAVEGGRLARSGWLRDTHSPFGAWINQRNERFGAVFAKKVTTCSVDPNELSTVIAYIHNNPVRAGIVGTASESTWTSHRAYLGIAPTPRWLEVERGLALMGVGDRDEFNRLVQKEAERPRESRRRRGRPKSSKLTSGGK
jgi:putative transposase